LRQSASRNGPAKTRTHDHDIIGSSHREFFLQLSFLALSVVRAGGLPDQNHRVKSARHYEEGQRFFHQPLNAQHGPAIGRLKSVHPEVAFVGQGSNSD
jgi:hypothetical protein